MKKRYLMVLDPQDNEPTRLGPFRSEKARDRVIANWADLGVRNVFTLDVINGVPHMFWAETDA